MKTRLALFLVAAATLMLELLLTRVFDVILTPNMAYMVIACALFSFGLAGVYVTLRPALLIPPVERRLAVIGLLVAATMLALLPTLNALPFDYDAVGDQPVVQVLAFVAMYLALVIPFFLSGLIFTLLFSTSARSIQTLYFWDLAGAAMGCVFIIPLLEPIGPGGLLFVAAAFALLASGLLSAHPGWLRVSALAAVGLVAIPAARSPAYFEFTEHQSKRGVKEARAAGTIEFSRWDPISKIDVIEQADSDPQTGTPDPSVRRKHIAYDGGTQSSHIFPFDGDYERLGRLLDEGREPIRHHFWHRGVLASHYAKRGTHPRVLIIGSAGGQETKAARLYGASHVDAVELVGAVVDLVTGPYAEYGGRVFLDPKVNVQAKEGRSFLRANADTDWDVIQIHSNHTSSSVAAGTGAMSPNYLQTADAYREYFSHLTEDGILHINHFAFPRMIATAALAWRELGWTEFQRHVVVFGMDTPRDTLPTLLIRMRPWTRAEVDDLSTFFAKAGVSEFPFVLLQHPLEPTRSFLSPEIFSGTLSAELLARSDVQLRPTTDDRPFFNFMRKRLRPIAASAEASTDAATAYMLNAQLRKNVIPMDLVHLILTAVASMFFACVFILVPLRTSAIREVKSALKYASMVYFSCLGAGFILFELVFIQVSMKLIGYPVYTYALVLFTMLFGAGIGSLVSGRIGISPSHRWTWPFLGVVIYGVLFTVSYPTVFEHFLSAPDAVRLSVAAAMILPLGFFLGMPFPLGILMAERQSSAAVAWAWGLNGLFTVIGSLASVLLGIAVGFQATLGIAIGIYAVAWGSFAIARASVIERRRTTPELAASRLRLQNAESRM
jgi:spermidine synthase